MKSLRSLSSKAQIQYIYDFVCHSLERGFNSIAVDKYNKIYNNNSVKLWVNEKNIPSVKSAMNTILDTDDFNIYKNLPNYRFLMLIFYIKNAIFANVRKQYKEDVIKNWEDNFNYINVSSYINSFDSLTFSEWVNKNKSDITPMFKAHQELMNKHTQDFDKGTAFFSFLRQNIEVPSLDITPEVQALLLNIKRKFMFKSIIIYPGRCQDIISALKQRELQFEKAARLLDVPNEAMGLNNLNVTFFLDPDVPNLSLIYSKVTGYFFSKGHEFNICIKNCTEDTVNTIVHEYGHFLSSLIYEKTNNRPNDSTNNIYKWDNDKYLKGQELAEAHTLMLDWQAKTLNYNTWQELQEIREKTAPDYGYRFLEHNFVNLLLKGIATPSESFLQSEPIIHNKMTRSYALYVEGIRLKLVKYGIIEEGFTFPKSNLKNATQFFLEQSSFIFYNHEIKNPYTKGMLRLAFIDDFVYYEANPEEIWARSIEALINTQASTMPDYRAFVNKEFSTSEFPDEMYQPQIHLNSIDRLHILYIIKYILKEYLPQINFEPTKSRCYKEFLANNIVENQQEILTSKRILDKSLRNIQK